MGSRRWCLQSDLGMQHGSNHRPVRPHSPSHPRTSRLAVLDATSIPDSTSCTTARSLASNVMAHKHFFDADSPAPRFAAPRSGKADCSHSGTLGCVGHVLVVEIAWAALFWVWLEGLGVERGKMGAWERLHPLRGCQGGEGGTRGDVCAMGVGWCGAVWPMYGVEACPSWLE